MTELIQAAHQIVEAILPALGPIAAGAASKIGGTAAESAWNWIKSKLTGPGQPEAVQSLEQAPADDTARQLVQLYIQQAAAKDEAFRAELLKRAAELASVRQAHQNAVVSGVDNKVVQVGSSENVRVKIGS